MVSASHPQVIIYTTPTCPDCWALKAWLEGEGIEFDERDLSDPKVHGASQGAHRWACRTDHPGG